MRDGEGRKSVVRIYQPIYYMASGVIRHRSIRFRFSGLYASSRAARPQGMRPIRREGLMHGYFHDRRSDTADAITVEEGRAGNESRE